MKKGMNEIGVENGKKKGCPPCETLDKIIDLNKPVYIIWNIFDFSSHCKRMKKLHPNWTNYQIRCCLYWQPKARNQLKKEIQKFLKDNSNCHIVKCPEASGVNVFLEMASIGYRLEKIPKIKTYQIVIAGIKYGTSTKDNPQ